MRAQFHITGGLRAGHGDAVTIVDNDQQRADHNTFTRPGENANNVLGSPFRIKYTGADAQLATTPRCSSAGPEISVQQPAGAEIATGGLRRLRNVMWAASLT